MAKNSNGKKKKEVSTDQIRELAYSKWDKAGRPVGDGVDYWLAAESQLKEENGDA